ncbi:Pimeloyl-ACP methyl ester carboxylesterase [Chitinophaga sp. CF118]|uniref:alpha/beta hydrolase n=1 Tax=Chitinophaga sp. CF118 TaxID=1884367 RepID=UPI0008ED4AF1|nr:alpha/beta hydrolase [Chitinophaga sp. CF118]SFD04440.1 Pimeloyl-ACP methyl ester carboxylesterase [Chitinophaga sp. CF118]
MKTKANFCRSYNRLLVAALFSLSGLFLLAIPASAQAQQVKNIVLVHGAFVDGSGWRGVYDILSKKGYNVSVAQIPLTSLKDDVDATNRLIDKQDGPVILVGHSWGGAVISEAGINPKVAGLVFVAAFELDKGENCIQWISSVPAPAESGIMAPDDKGFVYYDKVKFHAGFGADLSQAESDFMYASQKPIFAQCFADKVADAGWKTKPSYGIVALNDKTLNPDLERKLYKRANAKITEIKSSHVAFLSHPNEVAKVIIDATLQK